MAVLLLALMAGPASAQQPQLQLQVQQLQAEFAKLKAPKEEPKK
jgi:cell division protein FtsB